MCVFLIHIFQVTHLKLAFVCLYIYIYIYIYIYTHTYIQGNTNLMYLIKHLVHAGKYIAKHKCWNKLTKTAKLLD